MLLVGGETDLALTAKRGEVVRFYLTNTANTRVFKVKLPGARMKLVGGDSGHVEREEMVDEVILAPSERVVVDVLFDKPGELTLEHHTPGRVYPLATISVSDEQAEPSLEAEFETLRTNADLAAERERIQEDLEREPDKTLAFIAEMDMGAPEGEGPVVYACPMHPKVVQRESGKRLQVRDEVARGRGLVHLPDAPRGHEQRGRPLSGVRHEARAITAGQRGRRWS